MTTMVGLTNKQLRAEPVEVTLVGAPGGGGGIGESVTVTNFPATQPVSGPLTDAQLRAAVVPVSGAFWQATQPVSIASMPTTPVTGVFFQATQPVSIAGTVPVSGALTDTELRAAVVPTSDNHTTAALPISVRLSDGAAFYNASGGAGGGGLTDTELRATAVPVSGPLTDTQLRAAALPVSLGSTTITGSVAVTGTFYQATQPVSIASMPSTPVTGTFWQATQPVSGPLTDTELRAIAVPVSGTFYQATQPVSGTFWQATQPVSGTVTANAGTGTFAVSGTFWQATQPVSGTFWQATQPVSGPLTDAQLRASAVKVNTDTRSGLTYKGRICTFRTPGRAGTTGQKIFSIHNATGSSVIVDVKRIRVDLVSTAVRAITVQPALIRLWKVTVLPTNGTTLTKVSKDSTLFPTSSASVTILGDASADGTGSGTTLTATLPAGAMFAQEFGSRNFTAVGQEAADKVVFLETAEDVMTLRPLEGVVVFLDYATATFNPTTDFWTVACDWDEYTTA